MVADPRVWRAEPFAHKDQAAWEAIDKFFAKSLKGR